MSTHDRKTQSISTSTGGAPEIDFEAEHRPDVAHRASDMLLRRLVQKRASAAASTEDTHAAAERGIASPTTSLPFGEQIQASFGAAHDVSQIRAHVGGDSAGAMGANAFASGNHVVFDRAPDLHTAAHEAAHVVQQAHGVNLYGGVGEAGDSYERHADAVADRVVAGQSAADLLGQTSGGSSTTAIQKDEVQEPQEVKNNRHASREASQTAYVAAIDLAAKQVADAVVTIRGIAAHSATKADAKPGLDAQLQIVEHAVSPVIAGFNPALFDSFVRAPTVAATFDHLVVAIDNFAQSYEQTMQSSSALAPLKEKLNRVLVKFDANYAKVAERTKNDKLPDGNVTAMAEHSIATSVESLRRLPYIMDKTSGEAEASAVVDRAEANVVELEAVCVGEVAKKHSASLRALARDLEGLGIHRHPEVDARAKAVMIRVRILAERH